MRFSAHGNTIYRENAVYDYEIAYMESRPV